MDCKDSNVAEISKDHLNPLSANLNAISGIGASALACNFKFSQCIRSQSEFHFFSDFGFVPIKISTSPTYMAL